MFGQQERRRVLIAVKTYPTPAKKGVEVSCTAGVTNDNDWIRLFPVPFRLLDLDKRFQKYQWIDLSVTKAKNDPRPESYTPDIDSIQIVAKVNSRNKWAARREVFDNLMSHCMCCIQRERERAGFPTLGLFRPFRIERLRIEPADGEWTAEQLARLQQQPLFGNSPKRQLEKIPFNFKYEFQCDHSGCGGHSLSCTDWEMLGPYRDWRKRYGDAWEKKFRQKFEDEMIAKNDTHFYVGNMLAYPNSWLIVGLFYPRRETATGRLL
jgi:hypothetical protein